jgi:hypothetical protein
MTDRPTGHRFSLTYLSKGDPVSEKNTMRFRLGKLMADEKYHHSERDSFSGEWRKRDSLIKKILEQEIGEPFEIYFDGKYFNGWINYCKRLEIHLLLDAVTAYSKSCCEDEKNEFIVQANRIFKEENIAFDIDDLGGVHPIVDSTYEANKHSVISGMSEPRYSVSRTRIEEVDASLMESPRNYIRAIRCVFGANENLFKLMFGAHRLDAASANQKLAPKLQAIYADNRTMQRSSAQVLQSFTKWIDAAHHYRHEEGAESPIQPANELGIILISEGISFVRWLVAIDKKIHALTAAQIADEVSLSPATDE